MGAQTPKSVFSLRGIKCGQSTRKGAPCQNAPFIWFDHWPAQKEPGRCGVHLNLIDKETSARWRAQEEEAANERWKTALPACWTWPEPEAFTAPTNPWSALREWQDQRCAICGRREELVIDHDHDSGLVRGLLCGPCNSQERHSGPWARYRERTAAQILGVEIQYPDSRLGEGAPDLRKFRSRIAGLADEPCRRCASAKGDPCNCPPYFRLSAWRLASSIGNVVLIAARLNVNDIPNVVRNYLQGEFNLEEEFIKDLLRLPRLDYIAGKWFGGVTEAKQTPMESQQLGPSDPFPQAVDGAPTTDVPLAFAGRLVTALGQVGLTGLYNNDLPVQTRCHGLVSAWGLRLANNVSNERVAVGIDELEGTEHILRWVSRHLTDHGWKAEAPEFGPMLAEAFAKDAKTIREIREALHNSAHQPADEEAKPLTPC